MSDDAGGPATRRRGAPRRRRGRWLLGLLVVLAVLVGGAVLAAPRLDDAARARAEAEVAARVASSTGAASVSVDIGGGAFVPQVLRGRYPQVFVTALDVPASGASPGSGAPAGLSATRVQAQLQDVTAPLADLVRGDAGAVRAATTTATVLVGYPALDAVLASQGSPLRVADAPQGADGALRTTAQAEVLGRTVAVSADVDLSVADGSLRATPRALATGAALVDRLSREVLGDRLSFTVPVGELPLQQRLTGVQVTPGGLLLATAGTDVPLAG